MDISKINSDSLIQYIDAAEKVYGKPINGKIPKESVEKYLPLLINKVGFYGKQIGNEIYYLDKSELTFNSSEDINIVIEGNVDLISTPRNIGSGSISISGSGKLFVDGLEIHSGSTSRTVIVTTGISEVEDHSDNITYLYSGAADLSIAMTSIKLSEDRECKFLVIGSGNVTITAGAGISSVIGEASTIGTSGNRWLALKNINGVIYTDSSSIPSATYVDGVTITGDGTQGDPLVANPVTGVSVIQTVVSGNATNPVSSKGIYDYLRYDKHVETFINEDKLFSNSSFSSDSTRPYILSGGANLLPVLTIEPDVNSIYGGKMLKSEQVYDGVNKTQLTISQSFTFSLAAQSVLSFSFLVYSTDYTHLFVRTNASSFNSVGVGTSINFAALYDDLGGGFRRYYASNATIPGDSVGVTVGAVIRIEATAPVSVVQDTYVSNFFAEYANTTAQYYVTPTDYLDLTYNPYRFLGGLAWFQYGDSLTGQDEWQTYVTNVIPSSILSTNGGIGGTTVAENGTSAWVDPFGRFVTDGANPDPGGGATLVLSSMSNQQRIDSIPTDRADFFTIMGGVNDWSNNITLGVITDNTVNTFYGAYKIMLDRFYTRFPNARILLMNTSHYDGELSSTNGNGNTLEQFRQAVRDVAYQYRYPLVEWNDSGINENNKSLYLKDLVHINEDGGKKVAPIVLNGLLKLNSQ